MDFTPEMLRLAWQQVRRGSRAPGIDGVSVDLFASIVREQLAGLQRQLVAETYLPAPAKGFFLPKASGGKRLLGIPTVRDRIIQRLLLEELYEPLEDALLDCSYAYRPDRGIQKAARHLFFYYQVQPAWTIKADIARFFDSLCWALLMADLQELALESVLLQLISGQLAAGIVINRRYVNPGQGVLQGSALSGALANLYLNQFDRLCLSKGLNLVRYGDDFVVVCPDWIQATRALNWIGDWLGRFYLRLQPEKTRIFAPDEEFTFLGYRFAKGEVFAPPPPQRAGNPPQPPLGKGGQREEEETGPILLSASGMPYRRPKKRQTPVVSQPPKACSLKPVRISTAKPKHIWSDLMTTLYITDQGAYLKAKHHQFQVFHQGELRGKVPVARVSHIVLFGCCNLSHGAVSLALHRRIPVLYLSQRGRYFGRLQTDGQAKVDYLSRQVLCSQNPQFVRATSEAIVAAKLHNSRVLLQKLNRRRSTVKASEAIASIAKLIKCLPEAGSLDVLRGYEGSAAAIYFQALGSLFSGPFVFEKRTKRPPLDPINSMMSLGYTLLSQNVAAFIQAMGLHTHFGNLHVPRDNHPALVSDLMEEFRAQVVDSLVAYLVNKKIFTVDDFTLPDERGGVYMQPHALKKFLKHWEEKLQSEITHPHTEFKVSLRRCFELQVREYVSSLTGEVELYRPMTWKG